MFEPANALAPYRYDVRQSLEIVTMTVAEAEPHRKINMRDKPRKGGETVKKLKNRDFCTPK
jgi:hypothetical protein